jgi:hypothetical protein
MTRRLSCRSPRVQSMTSVRCVPISIGRSHGCWTSDHPSLGLGCPSTFKVMDSDLHRVCLTRLCCVFRLSQPLDALFRPSPLRPCFMPLTPLGFRSPEAFPPAVARLASRPLVPFMAFTHGPLSLSRHEHISSTSRVSASVGSVHGNSRLGEDYRPILSWPFSPPRCSSVGLGPRVST